MTCNINFSDQVKGFEERIEYCCNRLLWELKNLNLSKQQMITKQLDKATENLVGFIRYQFLDPKGPQQKCITKEKPLFPRYLRGSTYS